MSGRTLSEKIEFSEPDRGAGATSAKPVDLKAVPAKALPKPRKGK